MVVSNFIWLQKLYMSISSKEQNAQKVRILVDRDVVDTSFEKWAKPGHFSRTLAKGPKTTTWIWNSTCRCA